MRRTTATTRTSSIAESFAVGMSRGGVCIKNGLFGLQPLVGSSPPYGLSRQKDKFGLGPIAASPFPSHGAVNPPVAVKGKPPKLPCGIVGVRCVWGARAVTVTVVCRMVS